MNLIEHFARYTKSAKAIMSRDDQDKVDKAIQYAKSHSDLAERHSIFMDEMRKKRNQL